jgi:hypothetical protein
MGLKRILGRVGLISAWSRELVLAVFTVALGFGIMPMLIFFAGSAALGRYEGASVAGIYESVFRGLSLGSAASWIVVMGPYGLYLLAMATIHVWRAGARTA